MNRIVLMLSRWFIELLDFGRYRPFQIAQQVIAENSMQGV
jgi:hypothetical protein